VSIEGVFFEHQSAWPEREDSNLHIANLEIGRSRLRVKDSN
jgi:hypothetical protein